MTGALGVLPLMLLLWAVLWLAGSYGSSLPKTSWKRLPLALLVIIAGLGIPPLQFYVLAALESVGDARHYFVYLVVAECVPAVGLGFYAAIRGERTKKLRAESVAEFRGQTE